MAVLRAKDIRKMKKEEIDKKLEEFKLEMAKDMANIDIGSTVSSPGRIKEIKKAIARIKTIKKEESK